MSESNIFAAKEGCGVHVKLTVDDVPWQPRPNEPETPEWGINSLLRATNTSVTVCGLNVDMNVVEEDAVTQAEKDELVARVVTATNAHTDWKLLQLIAYLRNTGVKCAE